MNFLDLGLSEKTVKAINEFGIEKPTTVQTDVIPAILQGKDIFTIAPGGCGKTISYVLPLIDIINRKEQQSILIMTSDSQKSVMISDNLATLNRFHEEDEGGNDGENDSDVIIGSPDLLLDLVAEQQIDLSKVNILVVDDINLIKKNKQIENMEKILEMLPVDKQNIVYTNRRSRETQEILDKILKAPEEIKIDRNKEQEANLNTHEETIVTEPLAVEEIATTPAPSEPSETRFDRNRNRQRRDRNYRKNQVQPATAQTPEQVQNQTPALVQTQTAAPVANTQTQKLDGEALTLCKKYNSFLGKTPKFLLGKIQLADAE